jgi:hypothetical protein
LLVGVLDPTDDDHLKLIAELEIGILSQLGGGDAHVDIVQRVRERWRWTALGRH